MNLEIYVTRANSESQISDVELPRFLLLRKHSGWLVFESTASVFNFYTSLLTYIRVV